MFSPLMIAVTKVISSIGETNVGKAALVRALMKDQAIPRSTLGGEKFSFKWVIADNYPPKISKPLSHL